MNEIKKCSIAGISFTLEMSAYETLQAYIKSLNDTYKDNPDGEEIVESGWFDKANLPEIPLKGSIARAMIDAWLREQNDARGVS